MTAPEEPLKIAQGATRTIRIEGIKDGAKNPLDVTGWTVHAQVRPNPTSSTVWAEWRTADGNVTTSGSTVDLIVPHAVSSAWTWPDQIGHLHIEVTEPVSPNRRERFQAKVYLEPEGVR